MKEIKLYIDPQRKEEVMDKINFGIVKAGKSTKKKLFVFNEIAYPLNIEFLLKGKYVKIIKEIKEIKPKQMESIEFELSPGITTMKPISATLIIKINYLVV